MVWEDERITADRDVFGTEITSDEEILDPIGIFICSFPRRQTWVRAGGGDQNCLAALTDSRNGNCEIYGAGADFRE